MRQGLESGLKCDLADTQIRIPQRLFYALNSHSRQIRGERKPRPALEQFAKVESAQVEFLRHLPERDAFRTMFRDEILGSADEWRLATLPLDKYLVAQGGQLLGKNSSKFERSAVLPVLRSHRSARIPSLVDRANLEQSNHVIA